MDGWIDGRMDGRMDGWTDVLWFNFILGLNFMSLRFKTHDHTLPYLKTKGSKIGDICDIQDQGISEVINLLL